VNPNHLPLNVAELGGLRAARWIRESSARQGDRYGPTAQREMQDRAIERYGLVDTGRSWMVLKSGWSGAHSMDEPPATKTADFQAMIRAAEHGLYDVLLVGYSSRFLRDVQMSLHYRRKFHVNGVVILICDDEILTSDPQHWERFVDKVKADELYSRTHGRNVRTGLAAKRQSVGDPGGQPPLGFRREKALLAILPERMEQVRNAFALSATGQPDHAVADATGMTIDTVRHVLTNPIYIGRLSDGNPFRLGATIDLATWNRVADRRESRRTRLPGVAVRRCYPLKLTCDSCESVLHGHDGRYRHPRPLCAGFLAARPAVGPARGRHASTAGTSYPAEWYEAVVGRLLEEFSLTDEALIRTVLARLHQQRVGGVDRLTLARVARARQEALRRLEETRDVPGWQATVSRLDAEEAAARAPETSAMGLDEFEVRAYLANLGGLWNSSDPAHRQDLCQSLFEEVRVEGMRAVSYRLSKSARAMGLDRLLPPTLRVDMASLRLAGGPTGEVIARLLDAHAELAVANA
jgi:DNA invertase Pin-like site-specific DNA recombinase